MLKRNKKQILTTSLITLLPILIGLVLWNRLPDQIATHFDFEGTPNGWSGKGFTVFGLPLFLLCVHLFCTFVTAADPRRQNISDKMYRLVLWICPLISLFVCCVVYGSALGMPMDVANISTWLISILFIVIGNYLPKCRQNYTMGIKLPWTLASEENWNHTHRLAGRLWMAGGACMLLAALTGLLRSWMFPVLIGIMVLVPSVSSYLYYRRHGSKPD